MCRPAMRRTIWVDATGIVAVVFGLLTIREGGAVVLVDGAARAAAGDYVPFVVWFNFLAGFAYVITGLGLWRRRPWARGIAVALAVSTVVVFVAFGLHVWTGGAYEARTVGAMTLRSLVWIAIAVTASRAELRANA